jgi:hypothetical protein
MENNICCYVLVKYFVPYQVPKLSHERSLVNNDIVIYKS